MASFRDLLNAGERVLTDVRSGAYASAAHSLGDGLHVVGDLMRDLFGFRAGSDDPTDDDVRAFLVRAKTLELPVGTAPDGTVGAIDFAKLTAAFQLFVQLFEIVWNLFRPTPSPA